MDCAYHVRQGISVRPRLPWLNFTPVYYHNSNYPQNQEKSGSNDRYSYNGIGRPRKVPGTRSERMRSKARTILDNNDQLV